ncbi:MAG: response regulator [Bacteroidota bacterium]|nr:response regulator [Bacteroidota bacterium]
MEPKVFLVDDEASLRRTLSLGLLQKGYETEPCESGLKALKTLETYKENNTAFDYIVLDVKLPDIDGVKLLKVIKQQYPDVPVVLITGYRHDALVEEARIAEADAFLEKPFTADDLASVLAKISPRKSEGRAEGVETIAPKTEQKTASMYAALKFDESADLLELYRDLYFHKNVLYCDATKGDFDLVLLLQANAPHMLNEVVQDNIMRLPGLSEAVTMPVETPIVEEQVNRLMATVDRALGRDRAGDVFENKRTSRGGASSYVFLQVEKEKLDTIYPSLYFNDHVVYCDYVKGRYDIVLLMKGTSFTHIDDIIRTQIRPLDGVLKIKECPIINFFES